ncbi:MAG: NUDIX domain-containing protein, partial [Proteobacteria bacterium]|nr:NUDIX domain-containing protein [Pseudomonadota bacterium]
YARARNLHAAARIVVSRYNGRLPRDRKELLELPGIGDYIAGAVLSIAYGQAVPAVDGNVRRVICRLFAIQEPPEQTRTRRVIRERTEALVPQDRPGDFNQGLMELGATICRAGHPNCPDCPVRRHCSARRSGLQDRLPLRTKRKPLPVRRAVAGVVRDDRGRFLVVRRPDHGLLGGLWKWPGGEIGPDEEARSGLERTMVEEVGLNVRVGPMIATVHHQYTHFRVSIDVFECLEAKGDPRPITCSAWRREAPERFSRLSFSKADRDICEAVLARAESEPDRAGGP